MFHLFCFINQTHEYAGGTMLAHSHPLQGDFNRKQHQDLIIQTGTRETDVGLHLSQEGIPLNWPYDREK